MSGTKRTIVTIPAAGMTPRRIRWLWKDRLPRGVFSLLAGREGIGKSCLAIELAARVTRGELPGDSLGSPAAVFYVAAEDSWEHTVVPRLMAAGADLVNVHQVRVREGTSLSDPSLPTDIVALEAQIRERGARLIVLDPLISRLEDRLDTHKDSDVRRALEPLAGLAERTGATILGIIHVSKTDTTDPLTSVMGSRAFAATARAVLFAVRDGDANLLCFAKSNLGPQQRSRSYTVKAVVVANDPDDGQPITTGAVAWTGESDRSAQDVLEDHAASRLRSTRDRAKVWLRDELDNGPAAAQELKARAADAGIPERTLSRAADDLNVVRSRQGYQGGSTWALPDEEGAQSPVAGRPRGQGSSVPDSSEDTQPCQRSPAGGPNGLNGPNERGINHSRQPGQSEGAAPGPGSASYCPGPLQSDLTRRAREALGLDGTDAAVKR